MELVLAIVWACDLFQVAAEMCCLMQLIVMVCERQARLRAPPQLRTRTYKCRAGCPEAQRKENSKADRGYTQMLTRGHVGRKPTRVQATLLTPPSSLIAPDSSLVPILPPPLPLSFPPSSSFIHPQFSSLSLFASVLSPSLLPPSFLPPPSLARASNSPARAED